MKTFQEDNDLRQLIKSISIEKPSHDFTQNVMTQVFRERAVVDKLRGEPVLGLAFYILVGMFLLLLLAIVFFFPADISSEQLFALPEINSARFINGYHSILENLDALPAGITGVLFAFSLLLLLDKYLSDKKRRLA